MDYTQLMYGQHARHVPCWLYVQEQGEDRDRAKSCVSIVGASEVGWDQHLAGVHPLRFGSVRTHQLIVGEIVVRPHLVVATDALRGSGLAGLAQGHHDIERMLADGERIIDISGVGG